MNERESLLQEIEQYENENKEQADRIKELESDMQEFIDHASKNSLIGQTKMWKEKFEKRLKPKQKTLCPKCGKDRSSDTGGMLQFCPHCDDVIPF